MKNLVAMIGGSIICLGAAIASSSAAVEAAGNDISLRRSAGAEYHLSRARSHMNERRDLIVTFWITNDTERMIDLDGQGIWCAAEVPPSMGDDGESFQSAYFSIVGVRLAPRQSTELTLIFADRRGGIRGFAQNMTGRISDCDFMPEWHGQRLLYRDRRASVAH